MKKVLDNTSVPKNPWRYVNVEDSHAIEDVYFNRLLGKVKEYRHANNYPIGGQFDEQFEENICANSKNEQRCTEFTPPTLLQRASTFSMALWHFARSGFAVASEEEVARRMSICEQCNQFNGWRSVIHASCKACGCSKLKLAIQDVHCPLSKW